MLIQVAYFGSTYLLELFKKISDMYMNLTASWEFPTENKAFVFSVAVTDKFTESMYVLANEPSIALYRLQEHVRRSLPELVQHKVRCFFTSVLLLV